MTTTLNTIKVDYSNLTQNNIPTTWVITLDHGVCNDCENATNEQIQQLIADGFTERFQLLDDDNEMYYSGYAKPNADFDPLDDFGTGNAGCTTIKYYNSKTNEFETL